MGDWFYALRVKRTKRASKGYVWEGDMLVRDYDYDAGYLFDAVRSTEFSNLKGLAEALGKLERRDNYFVIRGELRGGDYRKESVNRRYLWNDPNHQPDWDARDRQWAMFDIDNIPWTGPEIVGRDEYERILVGIIRDVLPECFRDVSFYYHLSSSAGLTKLNNGAYRVGHTALKVHLWYWLDRPVCDASLRDWIRSNKMQIDAAPFNPVQPHYTSNPTFRGGDDHLSWRSGIADQIRPVLVLPDSVLDRHAYAESKIKKATYSTANYKQQSRMANCAIKSQCELLRGIAPGEGRHYTLNKVAFSLGGLVAHRIINIDDVRAAVKPAGLAIGITESEVERITEKGIYDGIANPGTMRDFGADLTQQGREQMKGIRMTGRSRRKSASPLVEYQVAKLSTKHQREWEDAAQRLSCDSLPLWVVDGMALHEVHNTLNIRYMTMNQYRKALVYDLMAAQNLTIDQLARSIQGKTFAESVPVCITFRDVDGLIKTNYLEGDSE